MRRIVLCLLLAVVVAPGCDKSDSKPNSEMKVPAIPPGRGGKGEAPKSPKG